MISKYRFLYRCKKCGYLLGYEFPDDRGYRSCLRCGGKMIFQGIEGEERRMK